MTTVTFTGNLSTPGDSAPANSLVAAITELRDQPGPPDAVISVFRETTVWVETELDEQGSRSISAATAQGLHWLPVFTSLAQLGMFAQASGRGEQEIHYGRLTGAEVLDVCLPALPHSTGVVVDPTSEHVFALPPVAGIVADSLAVDRDPRSES